MNETRHLIASNLTVAFCEATERRRPYLGEERRKMQDSPIQAGRIPSLSLHEVFHVYHTSAFCPCWMHRRKELTIQIAKGEAKLSKRLGRAER